MPQLALIAVDKAAASFDKLFSYSIPPALKGQIRPGCRVLIPFGAGNKKRQGLVFSLEPDAGETPLKPVFSLLDKQPVLNAEALMLARYLKDSVFCTYYEAVRLLIPAGLDHKIEHCFVVNPDWKPEPLEGDEKRVYDFLAGKKKGMEERALCEAFGFSDARVPKALYEKGALVREEDVRRRVLDEKITMVRPGEAGAPLTPKQQAVFEFLQENGCASLKETCYFTGVTRVVLDNMQKKGAVEYYDREVYRNPYRDYKKGGGEQILLSKTQTEAFERLLAEQKKGEYAVSLLFGVTGSGKTQVFLRLAQEVVKAGRAVLALVPEISLTPQTIETFHAYFGEGVAVMHSALSLGERLDEYKRIARGEVQVVVGTRSAVFAPLADIGLIIIDEEQEQSYKSEKTPRFHARDVAKWRAHHHKTQLVLASATPSVESFYFAKNGRYTLVELTGRYAGAVLPDVYIIDPREDGTENGSTILAGRLCDELYNNLRAGEQSILLLNRRGYHTVVKCQACGEPACCPNCSVSLTYHSANDSLCCHYCGYQQPREASCPRCGGRLARYQGAGTQRVEEELHTLYPDARVLRMDMDTTMQKFSHERLFGEFAEHRYDMMVGTQMVAKGLNFPDVTLVGVLCTDQSLYSDDFRSFERTFSLLTQVVGRAGRSKKRGRAYIQTFSPENPVVELASTQQYPRFYQGEIKARRLGLYPPFCDICAVGLTGEEERAVFACANDLLCLLATIAKERYLDMPLRILGPSDFSLYKMAGRYRRKLLLKCNNNRRFRAFLREALEEYDRVKEYKKVSVFVDLYYDNF